MQRPIPWFWIGLAALLLLLPSPAGRVLLDVLGGITLTLLLLPLLLGGAGLIAWQILRRRLRSCAVCGFTAMGLEQCPACGTPYAASSPSPADALPEVDARQVTIDVEVISDDED
ncbi:MAG: hypothetical protein VKM97_03820 [Cyanobacteriota bacterium]|nr:hypothetical protein [Cyanobacteriota bacterium]